MGVYLNCSVITRNLKGDSIKIKILALANPPPRKSRSDACFMSLELAWLEFNYILSVCSACNVSLLQCNCSVIIVHLQCGARAMYHNYNVIAV